MKDIIHDILSPERHDVVQAAIARDKAVNAEFEAEQLRKQIEADENKLAFEEAKQLGMQVVRLLVEREIPAKDIVKRSMSQPPEVIGSGWHVLQYADHRYVTDGYISYDNYGLTEEGVVISILSPGAQLLDTRPMGGKAALSLLDTDDFKTGVAYLIETGLPYHKIR